MDHKVSFKVDHFHDTSFDNFVVHDGNDDEFLDPMVSNWLVRFQQNLSLSSNCARNYGGQLSMTFLPCLLGHLEAPAQINQSHSWS